MYRRNVHSHSINDFANENDINDAIRAQLSKAIEQSIKHRVSVIRGKINKQADFIQEDIQQKVNHAFAQRQISKHREIDRLFPHKIKSICPNKKKVSTEYKFTKLNPKDMQDTPATEDILYLNKLFNVRDKLNTSIIRLTQKDLKKDFQGILYPLYMKEDTTSKNVSNTILSVMVQKDREFVKDQFIAELDTYRDKRQVEAINTNPYKPISLANHFNSFFGWVFNFSAKLKTTAAQKMIDSINKRNVVFKPTEIDALRDSRLGRIVKKYERLGVLPSTFVAAEESKLSRFATRSCFKRH